MVLGYKHKFYWSEVCITSDSTTKSCSKIRLERGATHYSIHVDRDSAILKNSYHQSNKKGI